MIDFLRQLPFLVTVVLIALLGIFIFTQPNRPGKRYFMLIVITWQVWSLAAYFEILAIDEAVRFATLQVQYFCSFLAIVGELFFVLEYTGMRRRPASGTMIFLSGMALVLTILMATNPLHHLFWSGMPFGAVATGVRSTYIWVPILFHYAVWLINLAILVNCMLRAPAFKSPILMLIIGQAIPRIAFFFPYLAANLSPFQITILATNFTALTYFLAMYNFRLLRVLPLVRDVVLEQMAHGVLVLDADDNLVDLNPAAHRLLLPGRVKIGPPAGALPEPWAASLASIPRQAPVTQEIQIHTGEAQQVFDVHSLPLIHTSGWLMGQVFVISDITSAWQARRKLLQQQWAEATLQEREQLAHELHDGLAQNLAFLNVQAQAAQVYLNTGQPEMTQACLDRMIEVSGLIQNDTREMINQLMSISLPAEGFLTSLSQVLESFKQQTGLQTSLAIAPAAEALCGPDVLDSDVVVQLLRIIQEALANVRKHALSASQVEVRMMAENEQLRVTIYDDGQGFEPEPQPAGSTLHFGLKIMRQRALRIGAHLSVTSRPNMGTHIEVCLPVGGQREKRENSSG